MAAISAASAEATLKPLRSHRPAHHHRHQPARQDAIHQPVPGQAGIGQFGVQTLCPSRRRRRRRDEPRPGRLHERLHRRKPRLSVKTEPEGRRSARYFACVQKRSPRRRRRSTPAGRRKGQARERPVLGQKGSGPAAAGASRTAGCRARAGADRGRRQKVVLRFRVNACGEVEIGPHRITQARSRRCRERAAPCRYRR